MLLIFSSVTTIIFVVVSQEDFESSECEHILEVAKHSFIVELIVMANSIKT